MKMAYRRQINIMGNSSLLKSAHNSNRRTSPISSGSSSKKNNTTFSKSAYNFYKKHQDPIPKDIHNLAIALFNLEYQSLEHLFLKPDFSPQLIKSSNEKVKSLLMKQYPNNPDSVNTVLNECSRNFEKKLEKNKKQLLLLYSKQKNSKNTQPLTIYKKHCSLCPNIAHHTCGNPLLVLNNSYIVCKNCRLLYSNNEIECLCIEDKVMFYSSILPLGYSDRFFTASYKSPHCNLIHEQMIPCKKCRDILFIDIKDNTVQCLNRRCLLKIEDADNDNLLWTCAKCGIEFLSAVKIYNSVEETVLKNEIKRAKIEKDLFETEKQYFHKPSCNGKLLQGVFKNKQIIICEKCEEVIYKESFHYDDNGIEITETEQLKKDLLESPSKVSPFNIDKISINKKRLTRNSTLQSSKTTTSLLNNNIQSSIDLSEYMDKHNHIYNNSNVNSNTETINSNFKDKQISTKSRLSCINLLRAKTLNQSLISLVKQQNEFNRRYQSKPKEKTSLKQTLNDSISDDDINSPTASNTHKNKEMFKEYNMKNRNNKKNKEFIKKGTTPKKATSDNITNIKTNTQIQIDNQLKKTPIKKQPPLLQIIDENPTEPSSTTGKTIIISDTPHSFQEPQTPLPTPFKQITTPTSIFVFNRRLSSKINNFLKSETPIELDLSKYSIHQEIGSGSYSTIYLVKEKETQNEFALKKLIIDEVDYVTQIQNEICLVRFLSTLSINIVPFINFCINKLDATTHVIYLLMPLAQNDFSKEILNPSTRMHLFTILKSLVHTLTVMQNNNICHRDIKPQNILYDNKTNQFYLCDFDEVIELEGLSMYEELDIKGTAMFMSHILYKAFKQGEKTVRHNAYKSDVYSLGMCFVYAIIGNYDMLSVVRDNDDEENRVMLLKYLDEEKGISNALIDVVCDMIVNDEESRMDFVELETFIKEKYELVF